MMNIQNLFITTGTGITVLFGVYSIYNVEMLRILNNRQANKIKHLKHLVYEKHYELQKKYTELSINYNKINHEINILNNKIMELQDNKMFNIIIPTSEQSLPIYIDTLDSIMCDLNDNILTVNMEKMNTNYKEFDNEFVESLSLDYDCKETEELIKNNDDGVSSIWNSENGSIKTSSSSSCSSTTEISWTTLTKKFIFG
jgi:hypothetical protein